ncbi:Radical SAM domain-containing protein [Desulfonema limicola]|uniref:Radical SAM domain-containing protein n=1 Tax=Desulfonema limicola TaxID=45656 RepID=A0A975GJH9_9BACT|nr:radical SAM protein [Desulfonema limicola]QTA83442.1 Radical SAM domain-containing protein [Desulfonema limicola]
MNNINQTVSFSKNAANVFFHILTKCNLKCRHCYINKKQHGDTILPISDIELWLNEFASKSSQTNIIFLGGEPTLHPDLSTAIKKARKLGFKSVTIDTNGYLFNDILSKTEPYEVDYFSFSLDGATADVNDKIRGRGCYEACLSGINKAVSKGFNTSLIFTVSSENIHELEKMPPLLKDLGITRFFIQVIGIRGNSADSRENLQVSRDKWLDLVPAAAQKAADHGIIVSYPKVFLEPGEIFECAGLCADNYFIFPNGRVYRCPLCEDFPIHSMKFENNRLVRCPGINEASLFTLDIPEGCVMNKLIQPDNICYRPDKTPEYRIACCMLKQEVHIDI